MANPTPVPGNWKNARTASNRLKPATIKRRESSPRLERPEPEGDEHPDEPGEDREPSPQSDGLVLRQIAENAEPVEAEQPEAIEQEAESGE